MNSEDLKTYKYIRISKSNFFVDTTISLPSICSERNNRTAAIKNIDIFCTDSLNVRNCHLCFVKFRSGVFILSDAHCSIRSMELDNDMLNQNIGLGFHKIIRNIIKFYYALMHPSNKKYLQMNWCTT